MADRRPRKARPAVEATSLRDRIPAIAPATAEALRTLHAEPRRWPLRDGGLLHFATGQVDAAREAFALDAEGTRLWVRFASGQEAGAEGLHWSDHVGRSRLLAWSLAHEAQLVRLSDGLATSLLPVAEAGSVDDDGLWLDFSIDDELPQDDQPGLEPTRGALRVPVAWLPQLVELAEPRYEDDPLPPLGRWRALPATVSILLSIAPLSLRDWRAIRPGDAIVVGRSGRPPAFQARAAGRTWALVHQADGWRVDGPPQPIPNESMENPKMSDQPAGAGSEDPARNLPVRIDFEIGQLELALGELADLQPGYVFALPSHLEGANVVIRANGRATGRGEVVAVGDTLGVRLLSWS